MKFINPILILLLAISIILNAKTLIIINTNLSSVNQKITNIIRDGTTVINTKEISLIKEIQNCKDKGGRMYYPQYSNGSGVLGCVKDYYEDNKFISETIFEYKLN